MRYISVLVLLMASLTLFPAHQAAACSCIESRAPQVEMSFADAVFTGRVVEIDEPLLATDSLAPRTVTFSMTRSWKGLLSETTEVQTALSTASCGFPFEENKEYIVYARNNEDGRLEVSLCSRTALVADADEDLAAFGRGITPADVEASQSQTEEPGDLRMARIATGILIGAGVGIWLVFQLTKKAS